MIVSRPHDGLLVAQMDIELFKYGSDSVNSISIMYIVQFERVGWRLHDLNGPLGLFMWYNFYSLLCVYYTWINSNYLGNAALKANRIIFSAGKLIYNPGY